MNKLLWTLPVWFHNLIHGIAGVRLVETRNGHTSYAWVNDTTWAERVGDQ